MKAILICGNEHRFVAELAEFRRYLRDEVGIKDITFLRANKFFHQLQLIFLLLKKAIPSGQLLVVYSGHGSGTRWQSSFAYRDLCLLISKSPNQVFLLDSSCHSGTILPILEASEVSPQKVGVITASLPEEKSYGNEFLDALKKCWRDHRVYTPEEHAYVFERGGDFSVRQEIIHTEKKGGWTIERELLEIVMETPVEEVEHYCPRWGIVFDHLLFPK